MFLATEQTGGDRAAVRGGGHTRQLAERAGDVPRVAGRCHPGHHERGDKSEARRSVNAEARRGDDETNAGPAESRGGSEEVNGTEDQHPHHTGESSLHPHGKLEWVNTFMVRRSR